MHKDHVVEHKVPCSPCHDEIFHKWRDEYIYNVLPERDVEAKDEEHIFEKEPYLLQREVYAGNGGRGVERSPDPMYLATVNCTACHKDKDLAVVDPMICNTCHEKGFDKTMAEQKEYITRMLDSLSEVLIESQKQGVPEALIDTSRYNYDLIVKDGSFGVHNIKYVKDLINHSIQRLE